MDKEAAATFVLREKGKYQKRDDIILKLCEQTGCSWPEAESIVRYVEIEHKDKIAAQHSPFMLVISIGFIAAGLLFTVGMVIATVTGWIFIPLGLPIPYLGNILIFLVGCGMLVGGISGIRSTLQLLWKR